MSEVEIPPNFCPVPWFESFIDTAGEAHLCCIMTSPYFSLSKHSKEEKMGFYNNPEFRKARRAILNGERLPGCSQCWKLESLGHSSGRTEALYKYRKEIPEILARQEDYQAWPKRQDMRYSPKCNLQCKMCIPHASDQVAKLVDKMKAFGVENTFTDRGQVVATESEFMTDFTNANPIADDFFFAGGEPFLMPEFHTFLDSFIESGRAAKTKIHILTNLTVVHSSILEKMLRFREVDFSCSMDGAGAEFEYQRSPSRWDKVKANFNKVTETARTNPGFSVNLSPCITHLNLRSLGEYLEFVYDREYQVGYNGMKMVMDEDQLDHRLVPMSYRPAIVENIRSAVAKMKSRMPERDVDRWESFADSLMVDHLEMTHDIAIRLQDAVVGWDFGKKVKWRDLYPWADELLEAATKFRRFRTYDLEGEELSLPPRLRTSEFML